jgi:hypothetical protein
MASTSVSRITIFEYYIQIEWFENKH